MNWLLSGLFWLSRVYFWNWGEVMFDSKEYLERWASNSLGQAIISGHPPLHSGYVFTFWPVFALFKSLKLDPAVGVLLGQTILAFLTVIFFYKIVVLLKNEVVALRAAVLLSILPIFWLVNEVIMMETTYLCFWTISYYYLLRFTDKKGKDIKNLALASTFWILAFLTHTVVIMWMPLFLVTVWIRRPSSLRVFLAVGFMTLLIASSINAYFLALGSDSSFAYGWYLLYGAKFNEHAHFTSLILGVLRYVRNWLMPLGYNNTWLLLTIALVSLVKVLIKDKKQAILILAWFLPSLVTNQWWDSLLFGRHALIASLALVIVVSETLSGRWFKLLSVSVLVIALSGISLLKRPIPYLKLAAAVKDLPQNGLYIESHFARPQVDGVYQGKTIFVDEPGWDLAALPNEINKYLTSDRVVMISAQALSEPYGLFCGPVLHNLSLSYKNPLILTELSKQYRFEKRVSLNPEINLEIYQVYKGEGNQPKIKILQNSNRRLDYLDPLRWIASQGGKILLGLIKP